MPNIDNHGRGFNQTNSILRALDVTMHFFEDSPQMLYVACQHVIANVKERYKIKKDLIGTVCTNASILLYVTFW